MDWVNEAKRLFNLEKPAHFTAYQHCDECAEHDETLRNTDVDSIGMQELGNPGWDPICFCSNEGRQYYLPAQIRLSLATIHDDFYFEQLLVHLELDGEDNRFYLSCTEEQRRFIAAFVEYMITTYADAIERGYHGSDRALRVHEIWSQ